MERRLQRDAGRLLDYHGRLRDEALSRFARERDRGEEGGSEDSALREGQRLAAIAREHAAKLDDLRTRYAVSVEIEWVQTLELLLPVQRFEVEIRRRKKTRTIALDLNACTRQLEMPACEYRYSGDRLRVVCDEALHLVGREGFAPCRHCQRPACRVCHLAGCPRCGRRW
jgi:hypothetical protein